MRVHFTEALRYMFLRLCYALCTSLSSYLASYLDSERSGPTSPNKVK